MPALLKTVLYPGCAEGMGKGKSAYRKRESEGLVSGDRKRKRKITGVKKLLRRRP